MKEYSIDFSVNDCQYNISGIKAETWQKAKFSAWKEVNRIRDLKGYSECSFGDFVRHAKMIDEREAK